MGGSRDLSHNRESDVINVFQFSPMVSLSKSQVQISTVMQRA